MQSQQQQLAHMAAMNANNGSVDNTPIMGNMAHPKRGTDPTEKLNTYIYDYFLRNKHLDLARAMLNCDLKMLTEKGSPSNRTNGVDSIDQIEDLPLPQGAVRIEAVAVAPDPEAPAPRKPDAPPRLR